ncbi:MAG: sulfatase-like hydrolase/transferase [Bryobacterales bacterium]|nr:sulfatase-like hydrolase/transferase [Bryobacterales bacterium]
MISRRELLHGSLGALGALGAAAGAGKRPNFLFILADDMGWGDLPCYGHRSQKAYGGWTVRGELQMPHLERMAQRGVRFTQYYVAQPVCSASRCGLLTGQFPNRLGIHDYLAGHELNVERGMPDALDPATPTITSVLGKAGYATAHFGKWHLSPERGAGPKPTDYGIGTWDSCLRPGREGRVRSSEVIADRTIAFLEQHKDEPFYINAWLYDPHSPLHPTEEMMALYEKLGPGWGQHKGALQVYYSVLTEMDKQVGRILQKLDELGLAENTVVIFSSDNGPENGIIPFTSHYGEAASAGPFRGLKRSLYEGGIRLPFLVQWPGKAPQGKVDNTTILGGVDLVPTLFRLAGVAAPGQVDGEDLSAALMGTPVERRRPLLWEWREPVYGSVLNNAPRLAIREGKWKLLMNPDRSRVELYDIPRDPSEVDNRAEQEPGTVRRLAARLLAWHKTLPQGPVHPEAGRNSYPWPKDY